MVFSEVRRAPFRKEKLRVRAHHRASGLAQRSTSPDASQRSKATVCSMPNSAGPGGQDIRANGQTAQNIFIADHLVFVDN